MKESALMSPVRSELKEEKRVSTKEVLVFGEEEAVACDEDVAVDILVADGDIFAMIPSVELR